jgi:hypothetical protein
MATISGPSIKTDNLLLVLDAASSRSYPGTGVNWYDLSGQNNNATSQASASTTTGIFDSEGHFNLTESADVFFLIPGLNNHRFGNRISIEFWMKNTGGDYRAVIQNSDSSSGSSDSIDVRFGREDYYGGGNNGTMCNLSLKISGVQKSVQFPVALNVFTHVHCNYSGSAIKVYLNGVVFASIAATGNIDLSANDIKLFRHFTVGEDLVNPFASIKIYNTDLSAAEVLKNYKANKNKFL